MFYFETKRSRDPMRYRDTRLSGTPCLPELHELCRPEKWKDMMEQ
jgi:hypothetical protein